MTRVEKLSRIARVFGDSTRTEEGREAFRMAYPRAGEEMIGTAAFHVYTDGVDAVIDWLLDAADFLDDPGKPLTQGYTYHVLYHLYNLQQFLALLPAGTPGLSEALRDFQQAVKEGDLDAAHIIAGQIEEALEAGEAPPSVGT